MPAYDTLTERLFALLARRVHPDTLPALLAAMTATFKDLLISEDETKEEKSSPNETEFKLCSSIAKRDSEVRRATAEVWSSALRQ